MKTLDELMAMSDAGERANTMQATGLSPSDFGLSARQMGVNPRALGTNPRALGTNPRVLKANRHPVDELADVRAELRCLKAREEELRAEIISGGCDLVGDQHEASVHERQAERLDVDEIKKEFGRERLRPFLRTSQFVTVKIAEREMPEELR